VSNRLLRGDVGTAVALAALALILAPGLAIVAMVAIAVLVACLVTGVRQARARRRGSRGRAAHRRDVSARRPARR
jgi:multisubunit Na+/H+ antiporter MnhB subunit